MSQVFGEADEAFQARIKEVISKLGQVSSNIISDLQSRSSWVPVVDTLPVFVLTQGAEHDLQQLLDEACGSDSHQKSYLQQVSLHGATA